MRMTRPSHPGPFIRTEIVSLTVFVTMPPRFGRPALSALFNGRAAVGGDGAQGREGFGVSMDTLLRMQTSYEIAETAARPAGSG